MKLVRLCQLVLAEKLASSVCSAHSLDSHNTFVAITA